MLYLIAAIPKKDSRLLFNNFSYLSIDRNLRSVKFLFSTVLLTKPWKKIWEWNFDNLLYFRNVFLFSSRSEIMVFNYFDRGLILIRRNFYSLLLAITLTFQAPKSWSTFTIFSCLKFNFDCVIKLSGNLNWQIYGLSFVSINFCFLSFTFYDPSTTPRGWIKKCK